MGLFDWFDSIVSWAEGIFDWFADKADTLQGYVEGGGSLMMFTVIFGILGAILINIMFRYWESQDVTVNIFTKIVAYVGVFPLTYAIFYWQASKA